MVWGEAPAPRLQLAFGVITGKSGTPLYFLPGGPGASAIGGFSGNAHLLRPLLSEGDVVLVEQRGAGFSRPRLDCGLKWALDIATPLTRERLVEHAKERLTECAEAWRANGINLNGFNTRAYAKDVIALADALGHPKFRILGFSFGTQVAIDVARLVPERVERMALLGTMGPADALRQPRDHDAVLARAERLLDAAAGRPSHLRKFVEAALTRLRAAPLGIVFEDDGRQRVAAYDNIAFRQQLVTRLNDPSALPRLPRFVYAIATGRDDEWLMNELRTRRLSGVRWMREGPVARRSAVQHYATVCAGSPPTPRRADPESVLGHTFHLALPEACTALGVRPLGPAFRESPRLTTPILLVSGDLDTKTPLEQAERLVRGFSNGKHLVVENAGHGELLAAPEPVADRVQRFLRGESVSSRRISLPRTW